MPRSGPAGAAGPERVPAEPAPQTPCALHSLEPSLERANHRQAVVTMAEPLSRFLLPHVL